LSYITVVATKQKFGGQRCFRPLAVGENCTYGAFGLPVLYIHKGRQSHTGLVVQILLTVYTRYMVTLDSSPLSKEDSTVA
jgi:hypothetical protein